MSYDWSRHTAYSDPGRHGALVDALPTELDGLSAVARNVIVHYRASGEELPESSSGDINSRWLEKILTVDQSRHPGPLAAPRPPTERVQGCCRDHTLFCVGALRQQGRPARSRVGFARYLEDGFHHDHVVVEVRDGRRWRRFDPELDPSEQSFGFDPLDLATGPGAPFQTAAEAYQLMRARKIDPDTYGADPSTPLHGAWFVAGYVVYEVAHRYGDELLLWDRWGAMPDPGAVDDEVAQLLDRVAALLVAADAGDDAAETELKRLYRSETDLHPGATIVQLSPYDTSSTTVRLRPVSAG